MTNPPPTPPPSPESPDKPPRKGSIAGGIITSIGAIVLAYALVPQLVSGMVGYRGPPAWFNTVMFSVPIVLLVLGVVLAVRRGTSRFGTGMLIGLGIIVVFAGLCVGFIFMATSRA